MSEKFNLEEYQRLVATIPEDEKKFLKQCAKLTSRTVVKLRLGGSQYKDSTLRVCEIIGSFRKPEEQAQISEKLYTYMMQDPEPTREQIVAEAERIAAQMSENQKEK